VKHRDGVCTRSAFVRLRPWLVIGSLGLISLVHVPTTGAFVPVPVHDSHHGDGDDFPDALSASAGSPSTIRVPGPSFTATLEAPHPRGRPDGAPPTPCRSAPAGEERATLKALLRWFLRGIGHSMP
jgi:hypothetical protein